MVKSILRAVVDPRDWLPVVSSGSLQQHLTRKTVNTDVAYLAMWSGEAAELIEEVRTGG